MTFNRTVKRVGHMALRGIALPFHLANQVNTGVMKASKYAHSKYDLLKKNMYDRNGELAYQGFHFLEASPLGLAVDGITKSLDYATHTAGAVLGAIGDTFSSKPSNPPPPARRELANFARS